MFLAKNIFQKFWSETNTFPSYILYMQAKANSGATTISSYGLPFRDF
jgi:hypothetical protein